MNMAVALEPYRHDAVFTQSPLTVGSPWKNSDSSALLHRETAYTAFQYPFALNLEDCKEKRSWTRTLLRAIGELNNVAGNHARSYFEMAPASLVVRLTRQLVAGYDAYGFRSDEGKYRLPEIVAANAKDLAAAPGFGLTEAAIDRLRLDAPRIDRDILDGGEERHRQRPNRHVPDAAGGITLRHVEEADGDPDLPHQDPAAPTAK